MYEGMTYEKILSDMLANIPDTFDKREGSIIYDALAPAALKMAQIYVDLDNVLALGFADTSNGDWLELRCNEMGIYRQSSSKAVWQATFNISVSVGQRFMADELYFTVIEGGTLAKLECETAGIDGNSIISTTLIPFQTIEGLTSATLTQLLVPGEDTESDEDLLARYISGVTKPATSGNIYHYEAWAEEVVGVKTFKVLPLWNGNGTVKVLITDSTYKPASAELITNTQTHIDDVRPVGATVTVESATAKNIDVSAILTLPSGTVIGDFQPKIEADLEAYFTEIIKAKESLVRYNLIGNILLDSGIIDYSNLLVNNGTSNISLLTQEIPIKGVITLG